MPAACRGPPRRAETDRKPNHATHKDNDTMRSLITALAALILVAGAFFPTFQAASAGDVTPAGVEAATGGTDLVTADTSDDEIDDIVDRILVELARLALNEVLCDLGDTRYCPGGELAHTGTEEVNAFTGPDVPFAQTQTCYNQYGQLTCHGYWNGKQASTYVCGYFGGPYRCILR